MSSRATIPAEELRRALADGGWHVESVHDGDEWWCREWWQLRSIWSPSDAKAFVAFLVDPQDQSQTPKIWAVRASRRPPARREDLQDERTMSLSRRWRQELPDFIQYLATLRDGTQ
jgi:hypothetical protein